jgi:hypothetical protein
MNLIPVSKVDVIPGIDAARNILNRCWFDEKKCAQGIKGLENYKKEWDERHACWRVNPLHNWASHCADAFRTLATGLHYITGKPTATELNHQQFIQQDFLRTKYNVGGRF